MRVVAVYRLASLLGAILPPFAAAQRPASAASMPLDSIARPIPAARNPLPPASATADIKHFSFLAYGDTRGRFDGEMLQHEHLMVVQSMIRTIAAMANGPDPVRFVVSSGDAVVDGRKAEQWNRSFVDVVAELTTRGGVPIFPAPGNHDVFHTSDRAAPDRQLGLHNFYSAFRAFIPAEGSPHRLSGYPTYAIAYGNSFVIAFDSNIAADSTQYEWIKGQLEALDRRRYTNVIIVCHQPAFSSGYHGGSIVEPQARAMRTLYMPLFRKHHVRLMLNGHEHLFEHWVERYQDATGRAYRLDQIVSGGGGAPLYSYQGEPDLREYQRAASSEHVTDEHLVRPGISPGDNPYHYVVVHVDGDRIRVDVVGVDFGRDFQPYRSRSADLSGVDVP